MFKTIFRAFRYALALFIVVMCVHTIGQAQQINKLYGLFGWSQFTSAVKDSIQLARFEHKDTELASDAWFEGIPLRLSAGNNMVLTVTDHTDSVTYDYKLASTITWTVLYFDGSNDPIELALGADGTYLMSNGASAAPTFETPSGTGDVTDVWNCAAGDCNTLMIGESEYLNGGTVDGTTDPSIMLPAGTVASSAANTEGSMYWNSSTDKLYIGSGAASLWHLKETDIDASSELLAIMDDETGTGVLVFGTSPTFTTGITVPNNSISDEELDEGADFTWTGTHDFSGGTIGGVTFSDSAGALTWRKKEMRLYNLWVSEGTNDDIVVFYQGQSGNYTHVYKIINNGVTEDAACTVGYVMKLPEDGLDDLDSARMDCFTSTNLTTDASIEIKFFKRTAPGTAATLCATLSSFATTGAWTHKLVSSFSPSFAENNEVELHFAITCDPGDSLMFNFADVHWTGRP